MSFAAEPPHAHDQAERTAVLLTNLGTPDAPTPAAVRKYLAEFLSDRRVVEIPRALWWPILHGIILRTRPAKSASKYAVHLDARGLTAGDVDAPAGRSPAGSLGERGHAVLVRPAMRYGQPSIASGLDALKAQGATRILVMPMYPQYSAATTASTFDAVATWSARARRVPELRVVNQFHDDEAYIAALASRVTEHWMREGRGRMLVMSFHGLPARTLSLGDPYHCQCQKTARLLAERLGLRAGRIPGHLPEPLRPRALARALHRRRRCASSRAKVTSESTWCARASSSDCLETLEEIAIEGRNAFLSSGGKAFHYIACLERSSGVDRCAGQARDPPPAGLADTSRLDAADLQRAARARRRCRRAALKRSRQADPRRAAVRGRATSASTRGSSSTATISTSSTAEPGRCTKTLQCPSPIDSALRICASANGPRIMPTTTGAVGKSKRRITTPSSPMRIQQHEVERRLAHAVHAHGGEDQDAGVELRLRRSSAA